MSDVEREGNFAYAIMFFAVLVFLTLGIGLIVKDCTIKNHQIELEIERVKAGSLIHE